MKIKTSELTGAALDYAIALCKGGVNFRFDTVATYWITINGKDWALSNKSWAQSFSPSTDWAQGGPIIERESIAVGDAGGGSWVAVKSWADGFFSAFVVYDGPTPLIAAMRCYVASKIGKEIDVPNELVEEIK